MKEKSDNIMSKAAQLRDNYIYLTIKFVISFQNIDGITFEEKKKLEVDVIKEVLICILIY